MRKYSDLQKRLDGLTSWFYAIFNKFFYWGFGVLGFWGYGDLAVNWNAENIENTGGGNTGMLLLRGWEDEMGEIMRLFYSEEAFTDRLREILVAHGFSEEAADNVHGSEWGMQDEGRASYDAYGIADEVRKHLGIAVAA